MMATPQKIRLGYYAQAPFCPTAHGPRVMAEVAAWSEQFTARCDRFVCFMNSNPSFSAGAVLADGAELVDLGPLPPHWQRTLGIRVPFAVFRRYAHELDAVIIQGPTSMLPHVARAIQPALPVFFLVGFWTHRQPYTFRAYGQVREAGLRLMRTYSEWDHRRVYSHGIITGNNTLMGERFGHLAPFHLITHSLIRSEDVVRRPSHALHDPMRLLSLGRVDPDKHLETLLDTCVLLRDRLNFVLDIVGGGWPTYVDFLRRRVYELGLETCVRLHGMVPFEETTAFYRQADLFIFHTSGTEGFPKVIWEAFAQGVPVIAAEYPGAVGILTDHRDVLLFPRRDAARLVECILEAVQNETLRTELAANGLGLLRENTLETSCGQMVEVIEQAVAERKKSR